MTAQLKFRDVTLGYDRHPAVHHLTGEVASGALLAVIGPNGAGKSTLFRGIAGILKPLAGSIHLGGLDAIESAISTVGLTGFEGRAIGTLSGGQMQRMLFARVLLQDARLIVLDEPFNAIDAKTSVDLLALVKHWHGEKRTVLAALHDMDLVRNHFPETLLLARGPVAWGATEQVLTAENLMVALRMCEAFDETAAACFPDDVPSRAA